MRSIAFGTLILLSLLCPGQSRDREDFSVALERGGCEGICPWYSVTIRGDGSARYEGQAYVRIEGVRKYVIPRSQVQQLIQDLREEDFFHWEEKTDLCVDYPLIKIDVILGQKHKEVQEGCLAPGKVLELAKKIDRISGSKAWVGTTMDIAGGHFVRDENGEWRFVKTTR